MEKFEELKDEAIAEAAGGIANMPNPFSGEGFANMPNPFAKTETVTVNPKVFDGAGHRQGESWTTSQGILYMVKPGDSLYQIAMSHGMTLSQLEQLNTHITNFKWIHPGDVIMLSRA